VWFDKRGAYVRVTEAIDRDFLRVQLGAIVVDLRIVALGIRGATEPHHPRCQGFDVERLQTDLPDEAVVDHGNGIDGGGEATRLGHKGVRAAGGHERRKHAGSEELEQDHAKHRRAQRHGTAADGLKAQLGRDRADCGKVAIDECLEFVALVAR